MYIQQYCDNQIIREGSINSFHGIFFLNYNGEFIELISSKKSIVLKQEIFNFFQTEQRLTMFMTSRRGGVSQGAYDSLNLGYFSGDEPENVRRNRSILCEALGVDETSLVVPKEVHGNDVRWVCKRELPLADVALECDALVTTDEEVVLGVTTADCVPILLCDANGHRVAAAIHAGWKGVVKEILPCVINEIHHRLEISPNELKVKIFPSISVDDFEVGEEVAQQFQKYGEQVVLRTGFEKPHVDLHQTLLVQALQVGVLSENIEIIRSDQPKELFFSARRDGFHSGRMLTGIYIHKY